MYLPMPIFYHHADNLTHTSPGFLLSPRRSCRPWGERRPPERYPGKLDRSRYVAYAVAFRYLLPQVGAIARDLMRVRTSAKRAPGTATSAIWKTVLREWEITLAPILTSLSWTLESDQWDIGDHRVIYTKTVDGIFVLRIGHREDIYRTRDESGM